MTDIVEMLEADHASAKSREQRNRSQFPSGAARKDLFASQGVEGSITYADNTKGESIGKRDFNPDAPCSLVDAAHGGRPEWRRWV